MSKRETYKDDGTGDFFLEFLPPDVYKGLSERVKKDIDLFHKFGRARRAQEKGIMRVEKKLEPLLKDLKDRKEKLKRNKRIERYYYNKVSYLKDNFIPTITVYEKDESSKSYKSQKYFHHKKKTHKGEPLKKRIVLYSQIKLPHHKDYGYIQKNIYLGSYEKVRTVCGKILEEDLSKVGKRILHRKVQFILLPYIQTHSKEGFDVFVSDNHPFHSKIVKWCLNNKEVYKKRK